MFRRRITCNPRKQRPASGPLRWLARYLGDRRGAVSPILVLALAPIIGAMGVGLETTNWWTLHRSLQNAADSAALAASWNGGTTAACSGAGNCTSSSYSTTNCATYPAYFDCEAVGAAANAGFTNGSNGVVVYPQYLTSNCPGTLSACYKVTVRTQVKLYLLSLLTGGSSQSIQAVAYSGLEASPTTADCLFALGSGVASSATVFTSNGAPGANLNGCDIQVGEAGTSVDATCNGHDLLADASFTTGSSDSNCGNTQVENATGPSDPYATLVSNIPSDPCNPSGGLPTGVSIAYPQEATGLPNISNAGGTVTWGGTPSGTVTWGSTKTFCGDVQLMGDVTVNSNTTIVIYNGQLDMNGHTFQTGDGYGNTVVFTGSNTFSYQQTTTSEKGVVTTTTITVTPTHAWSNNGTIDVDAPTAAENSTWSGIAVYQDPGVTSGVSIDAAGGSPTMDFTGVIYQPNANDTFSGAINKSEYGFSCFVWVVDQMTINGAASIFQGAQSQCSQAGVTQVYSDTAVHRLVG